MEQKPTTHPEMPKRKRPRPGTSPQVRVTRPRDEPADIRDLSFFTRGGDRDG